MKTFCKNPEEQYIKERKAFLKRQRPKPILAEIIRHKEQRLEERKRLCDIQ